MTQTTSPNGARNGGLLRFVRNQLEAKRVIYRHANAVRQRTGKSVASQFAELTRLRLGRGALTAEEYFMMGVWDDRRYTPAAKRQVVSWHPSRLSKALNDPAWAPRCHDKLAFYDELARVGLPYPAVHAAFDSRDLADRPYPVVASADAMAALLRDGMPYPTFGKPTFGQFGRGASSLVGYDRVGDRVVLADDTTLPVDEYVREYVVAARTGYLFQTPIRQHPEVDRLTGGRVATVRMAVLRGSSPALFRTVWRVPVGRNITDNFQHGAQGNLLADIATDTGRVRRVVQIAPTSVGSVRLPTEIERHPDTHERLLGAVLPGWSENVALCFRAAEVFAGLRYQAWDLVMGVEGPMLLEVNFRGSIDVLQLAGDAGLDDAQFRAFWSQFAREP